MSGFVIGIDVAAEKRGFHVARLGLEGDDILEVAALNLETALAWCKGASAIAIDAPPRALICGPETRLAERAMTRLRYRVQWTRKAGSGREPQTWMLHGERLWRALEARFDRELLFETFPTPLWDELRGCPVRLPLSALRGPRKDVKDLVDACLCAWLAREAALGRAVPHGTGDELGPIWLTRPAT